MSLLLAASLALFAATMLVLLVVEERPPLQQAILGASIATMILGTIDQIVGTPVEVFVPTMTALLVGSVGIMLYEYGYNRRGRVSE